MFQGFIKWLILSCQRRLASRLLFPFLFLSLFIPTTTFSDTLPPHYQEGKHYQRLPAKITTDPAVQEFIAQDPGKIQVIEFFNYGCFWCSRLHPLINEWLKTKPDNVVFYRVPVTFTKHWENLAKAYYIVKLLGKTDTLDSEFFKAIYEKHLNLGEEKNLQSFFKEHGVDEVAFTDHFRSFTINHELAKGRELEKAFQITVSPALVVNTPQGSYLLTGAMAQGIEPVIAVLKQVLRESGG